MSSVDNVKTVSHLLNGGADDYIVKPFHDVELMARIRANYRSFMLREELERLAITDSLTKAYNHGFIVNSLKKQMDLSKKSGEPLSLLMVDIDFFKKVNDTYGHSVGDDVIISLAELFMDTTDNSYILGRIGGEEFILIMPNTEKDKAFTVAKNINVTFSEMTLEGIDRAVTFSGGLVLWDGLESLNNLLTRVDTILYESKTTGRNKISQ